MSMSPPIISDRDQIFCQIFCQNLTPIKESIPVISQIIRAGKYMLSVLAVSDIPTASASMLVAIERNRSDLKVNIFLSIFSSDTERPSRIIFIPIYPSSTNAIQ